MLKIPPAGERRPDPARPRGMTAGRRKLGSATAAALIVLLVGLLASSPSAVRPVAGSVLAHAVRHHLTMPGIVRAEVVSQELHPGLALRTAGPAGLVVLGWVLMRVRRDAVRPVALPVPAGRDPPPAH